MVRHRGLFPIPVPLVRNTNDNNEGLSRSVRRRLEVHNHVDNWHRDLVQTLNAMYAGDEHTGNFDGDGRPTLSQRICLSSLKQAILDAGKPPDGMSGQEALAELRAKPGYGSDPTHLAPMDLDLISLPPPSSTAASLEMIFGEGARKFRHRLLSMVSADAEVKRRKIDVGLKAPYVDPLLRSSPRKYADFCRLLHERGLVEYRLQGKERVGVFTVWKKSGKQRLVIDARLANLHFEAPPSVSLATGASFGLLEVPGGGPPLEVGGVDIADAFYHIALDEDLRELFSLAPLRAEDVGIKKVQGLEVRANQMVFPCLKVVPMGWTLALWICQSAHEHVVDEQPGIDPQLRYVDRRPVPELKDYVHTQYVDNFVAISQTKGRAKDLAEAVGVALNKHGLPTHEVEAGYGLETLGWAFSADHPRVSITSKRLWRMRLATLELLKDGKANGRTIERLVGHYTFAGLMQRGMLSVFQAVYCFIRKNYDSAVELWPEVKRELKWAASLLCLVRRDLSSEWSTRVHATDASLWGRGVVATERPQAEIQSLGRRNDRWRFNVGDEDQVCRAEMCNLAQRLDPESLHETAPRQLECLGRGDYLEVPLDFIGNNWTKVDGAKWDRVEPIPVLEGRSVVWLLQHLARSQKNLGRKHLVLSDSMSVTLALTKGRSSSSPMNRVCRQVAALCLATGMTIHVRWIPSELNPADLPSRAQKVEDFKVEQGLRELQDNYVEKGKGGQSGWRRTAIEFHCHLAQRERASSRGAGPEAQAQDPLVGAGQCTQGGQGHGQKSTEGSRERKTAWPEPRSGHERPEDLLGDKVCWPSPAEVLRQGMVGGQRVCEGQRLEHGIQRGARSCGGEQDELHVLRWLRRGRCDDHDGCSEVPSAGHSKDSGLGTLSSGLDRLSEARSTTGSSPTTIPHAGSDCPQTMGAAFPGSHLVADGVGDMLPTRRSLEAEKERSDSTHRPVQVLDCDPELRGRGTTSHSLRECRGRRPQVQADIKGGGLRRGNPAGPTIHARPGKAGDGSHKVQETGGAAVHLRPLRCDQVLQRKDHRAAVHRARHLMCVPSETWKRIDRRADGPEVIDRRAEAWSMGSRKECQAVLQRRPHLSGVRQSVGHTEARGHPSRVLDQQDFRSWRVGRHSLKSIGLEIFSGSGHFSRAVRRRLKKVFCAEVDVCHGPQFDLTSPKIQKQLLKLVASGQVAYVWLGTPCNSWSRARRNDGKGPGPLRDDGMYLMGFLDLPPHDLEKIRVGNVLMKFSAKMFRCCLRHNVPIALENPHTSRLWLAPPIKHLLLHKATSDGYTDFCMDGKPFRKRTRLMWANVDLSLALRHCASCKGVCSRTLERHEQLQGSVGGQFRTLLAQPYPHRLCQRLASAFHAAVMYRASEPLWELIQG